MFILVIPIDEQLFQKADIMGANFQYWRCTLFRSSGREHSGIEFNGRSILAAKIVLVPALGTAPTTRRVTLVRVVEFP